MIGNRTGIKNVDYPGCFRISRKLLETKPSLVRHIMYSMTIIRAEYIFSDNHIHYMALSPLFLPVAEGKIPPGYDIIINKDGDVYFQKV